MYCCWTCCVGLREAPLLLILNTVLLLNLLCWITLTLIYPIPRLLFVCFSLRNYRIYFSIRNYRISEVWYVLYLLLSRAYFRLPVRTSCSPLDVSMYTIGLVLIGKIPRTVRGHRMRGMDLQTVRTGPVSLGPTMDFCHIVASRHRQRWQKKNSPILRNFCVSPH